MKIFEYAYWGEEIVVREVECEKCDDMYIGVGVAVYEHKLGTLIGSLNVYLMYLIKRDDMKFARALVSRISDELLVCIKRANKLNHSIEQHFKNKDGVPDEKV
ncbi:MAG: hypothetical protein E7667_03555 [Ruminococcaceae bacterium]|nr:hypothetical protein [Oscillospiraceae bacterium]